MELENIKNEIFKLAQKYYESQPRKKFIPGETYIPVTAKQLDHNELIHMIDASLDMWLTAGRFSKTFEERFAKLFGRMNPAILVNSGSSANLVAISALGSPHLRNFGYEPLVKGDEVITLAAGFPTTVNPIVQNGWTPVFIDIDRVTLNALPENIFSAVTPRTRAIVLAHTLGNPYRADLLQNFCKENKIFLMEDCCDALGAKIGEKPVGSFGEYATTSFYPAHHITMGEGGAVVSRDPRFRKIAESIRDWGRDCWCEPGKDNTCQKRFGWQLGQLPEGYDHKYIYSHIGYNLKVSDMQAAVGVAQLAKLDGFVKVRNLNWNYLYNGIKNSPVLNRYFIPVEPTENTKPSWFGFPVYSHESLSRAKIVSELEKRKIGTRLLFAGNLTKQPAYQSVDFKIHDNLQNTDAVMNHMFWLGVHPNLEQKHLDYILEQLEIVVKAQV